MFETMGEDGFGTLIYTLITHSKSLTTQLLTSSVFWHYEYIYENIMSLIYVPKKWIQGSYSIINRL